ncbi:RNase adaptor protein RapZ [Limosilactobacillus reuteri]|uniref:RNase adapter RapZ n=3 Tax=Limosilactobacillus reuteri TaxID=1598 RepID=A0A143PZS4_LIMRT|nr:RNase adapter RapZ [Limosilactobacillus reuteri]AMY13738.1 RNase adaptor protein RapZ [Limosilactobacillus reuteri]MCC4324706.1 RNase adapter RapZ [Limosilactobacillus reuteri]MCC4327336.1 RNase adapter RapZ [Limosilactobacillus reuteri]MCC4334890.1 RNase adapter RapZ [Limosilactobacillus reuteri]MCC4335647.1 RNase adapter RapZ [Limosilactobacillus reuteri]
MRKEELVMVDKKLKVVIITGMSGAGKTVAVHSLEDLGYFVIDNMLPGLAERFVDVIEDSGEFDKIAMVMDMRSRGFYDEVLPNFEKLKKRADLDVKLLFLDANDVTLISRYKETRRSHPLSPQGRILDGVELERKLSTDLKSQADIVIDTTNVTPRNLKLRLNKLFGHGEGNDFYVEVMSFGFKYGLPLDADIVMDVRFLPNPFYIPELKHLTGNDPAVQNYVMQSPLAKEFYQHLRSLLEIALPGYIKEGKSSLTIAIGCTGGQHRSVTIANKLSADLKEKGYKVNTYHRDIEKAK